MAYSWLLQIAPEQRKAVGAMLSVGSIQSVLNGFGHGDSPSARTCTVSKSLMALLQTANSMLGR